MNEFEVLLSGMPEVRNVLSELRDRVLCNGPLDARGRAIATVAVAIATSNATLSEVLVWAKQAGMRNEEISHIAAIAAVLRASDFGSSTQPAEEQQPTVASCC